MKVAFITDTHLGARGGSQIFREYFEWYYTNIFFPYLVENDIKDVIHLGDFFDNRNHVSLKDIAFVKDVFVPLLKKYKINMSIIAGNHDLAYKNTNAVTSLSLLEPHVSVFKDEVLEFEIGEQRFAYVPWINSSNYDEFMEKLDSIQNKDEVIVLGHFEIKGFLMYKNSSRCEHGLDQKIFKKFKSVWSGHFHHPSKIANIEYLGSLFEFNWQDYGDPRGFWVYDSEKDEKEYVENEYHLFNVIDYTDDIADEWSDSDIQDAVANQFVKIQINNEYDKIKFMDFYNKVSNNKPIDVQIENNYAIKQTNEENLNEASDYDGEAKEVDQYIDDYIDSVVTDSDKKANIKRHFSSLLDEAKDTMVKGE